MPRWRSPIFAYLLSLSSRDAGCRLSRQPALRLRPDRVAVWRVLQLDSTDASETPANIVLRLGWDSERFKYPAEPITIALEAVLWGGQMQKKSAAFFPRGIDVPQSVPDP